MIEKCQFKYLKISKHLRLLKCTVDSEVAPFDCYVLFNLHIISGMGLLQPCVNLLFCRTNRQSYKQMPFLAYMVIEENFWIISIGRKDTFSFTSYITFSCVFVLCFLVLIYWYVIWWHRLLTPVNDPFYDWKFGFRPCVQVAKTWKMQCYQT